MVEAVENWMG